MTAPVVLHDVHVSIREDDILSGVSLTVNRGSATGVVGESGSGKTMTVRAATGMLGPILGRVTHGSVTIQGQDMSTASQRSWDTLRGDTIALIPQNSLSSLDPIMKIGRQMRETLLRAARIRDWAREAERLLHRVHLDPTGRLLNAYPHELSGGMRQRVVIALALAVRPVILVADEPTTALDASIRFEILELLNGLREEYGLALMLVSHDLSAIKAATDQIVVMYRGRVVESGPTSAVIGSPQHPYTRSLLLARPELTRPGDPIPQIPADDFDAPSVSHPPKPWKPTTATDAR